MKIPERIKAVIFDMDGLIIDSEPYWTMGDKELFKRHNKRYSAEIDHYTLGMGQREVIEYFKKEVGFVGNAQALIAERRALMYKFFLKDIQLMEGVKILVSDLYGKNLPLAIATGGHSAMKIRDILNKVNLTDYFSIVVSGDDVSKNKPAPDIFLKTAKLLKIEPKNCLVLEDASNGVKAGKAAGMMVYGVNKDILLQAELRKAGADKVLTSLTEII